MPELDSETDSGVGRLSQPKIRSMSCLVTFRMPTISNIKRRTWLWRPRGVPTPTCLRSTSRRPIGLITAP